MSTEEAFKAAVNIIRSMPKEGPFQPSPDLMLRFYALYKQATEGICTQPKPAFWAVIAKAKWDAWKCLGNMPREEAMTKYVNELKQIVETMSYSEEVANFMHVLGPFYDAVYDGQEPDNLRPASATGMVRDSSPQPSLSDAGTDKSSDGQLEDESGYSSSVNGTGVEESDGSGDVHGKRIDEEEETVSLYSSDKFYSDAESDAEDDYKDPLPDHYYPLVVAGGNKKARYQAMTNNNNVKADSMMNGGSDVHVAAAVQRLQADLKALNGRLDALEAKSTAAGKASADAASKRSTVEAIGSFATVYSTIPNVNQLALPTWFPFKDMNVATVLVVLGWPFVAQYLVARWRHRAGV